MKLFQNKKIVIAVLLVLSVVLILNLGQTGIVNAQSENDWGEFQNLDTTGIAAPPTVDKAKESGGILFFLGSIAGAILNLLAGMIEWAVELGQQVIGLDVVRIGSGQVLAFANLGFVLAIIIIAFATIFRVQSYAMKQTLWKLIAAALLVNFSLTIAGAFISVSDILTTSFLSQIKGGIGSGLAGIVNPQTLPQTDSGVSGSIFSLGYWLKYLVSIFFVVIFSFILVLIFAFIFVMFLIRDVALALLLIVMPIVWLAWIFPGTVQHWQKWWREFMRWLFFGPIALFFIVLVVNTGNQLNSLSANIVSQGTIDEVSQAFERNKFLEPGFFAHVGQMFIVGGLLIGGVMLANKLGLFGSKAVYGGVQNVGKSFTGWVGRKGLQYGPGAYLGRAGFFRKGGEKSNAERIQEWAARQKPGIARWGAGLLAGGTAKLAAAGRENLVDRAKKELEGKSLTELRNVMATTLNTPKKIAATEKLKDMKELGGQNITRLLTVKQRNQFKRFGKGNVFSDIEKSVGASVEMMDAAINNQTTALKKATDEFTKKMKLGDIKSAHLNDIYSETPKFGRDKETSERLANSFTSGLIKNLPNAFSKIRPQIAGVNQGNFKRVLNEQLEKFEKTDKDSAKIANGIRESLEKNMGELTMDWGESNAKS